MKFGAGGGKNRNTNSLRGTKAAMDLQRRHALSKGQIPNSITRQAASSSRQWTIQPRAAEYI
ncbi:hypothetical protein [Burkholderia seminalis]|uniref:hypothetical protein n=1 Tax=Burkholderia seminalis TaxID=488731 RepID=UPI001ABBB24A|nr:hypothetical protein [Burkholderia seminalis]